MNDMSKTPKRRSWDDVLATPVQYDDVIIPKRIHVPRSSRIFEERREQLTLRVTSDLAIDIRHSAKMRGLSITDWLEQAVKNNLK